MKKRTTATAGCSKKRAKNILKFLLEHEDLLELEREELLGSVQALRHELLAWARHKEV